METDVSTSIFSSRFYQAFRTRPRLFQRSAKRAHAPYVLVSAVRASRSSLVTNNTPGSFPPAISIYFFFIFSSFFSFFFCLSFASSSHSALLRNRVSRQPAHTLSYFSVSLCLSLSLSLFVVLLSHGRSRDLENCRALRNVTRRWRQQPVPRTQF